MHPEENGRSQTVFAKRKCFDHDAAAKNRKEVLLPKAVFRRKILDQAKFLSKGRVAVCGTASHGFKLFFNSKFFFSFTFHTYMLL